MANAEIPLFDMKIAGPYIFCAGGGGSKEYGKENGIAVARKEAVSRGMGRIDCFYKTKDLISSIQVYTPAENHNIDPSLYQEFPEDGDGTYDSTDSTGGLDTAEQDTEARQEDGKAKGDSSGTEKRSSDQEAFIAAIGDEFFYFLRFEGVFTLLSKMEKRVRMSALGRHLFLLCNHEIYGFYDAVSNPSCIRIGLRTIKETDASTEEYLYRLVRSRSSIVPKNESGTSDIAGDWESFFTHKGSIHKVILSKGKNVFVFKNEKYEIEGRMSRVVPHNDTLAFYSNTAEGGTLYFINSSKKVYKLPKITAFGVYRESVVVATCKGDAVVYSNGKYVSKVHTSSVPVTGVSMDDERVYFSVLTGEIESTRYKRHHTLTVVLIAALALALGLLIAFLKYK